MTASIDPLSVAAEKFVSLTTWKRSGEAVATPVWIARDGDALIVTTPSDSGKVKRLRNNPAVQLRPSSRMGRVADDAPTVTGAAEIIRDPAEVERCSRIFATKYGAEYRVFMFIERRFAKEQKPRAILRITSEMAV